MEHRIADNEKCQTGKNFRPTVWVLGFIGALLIINLINFFVLYISIGKENTVKYNISFYIDGDSICSEDRIQVQLDDDSDEKITSELAANEEGVYTISKNAVLGMTVLNLKCNIKEFENVMDDFHAKLMHYNSNEIDDIVIDWKINCTQSDGKWKVKHTINCKEGSRNNGYKVQGTFNVDEEQEMHLGP